MSGSVNKVILVGNVGRDPEVRRLNSGDPVASFSVATSETWRDKASGERRERTEWHNVVIFNENLAKIAEQYLKKGSKVYLEGQLQTRKYTDKNGQERQTTEVVLQRYRGELTLLDSRGGGGGGFRRPRGCEFCKAKTDIADYKDAGMLRRYLTDSGKMEPRRKVGTCARHQRVYSSSSAYCRSSRNPRRAQTSLRRPLLTMLKKWRHFVDSRRGPKQRS